MISNASLAAAAHLPHYTSSDVIIGTVIFAVLFILIAAVVFLRR